MQQRNLIVLYNNIFKNNIGFPTLDVQRVIYSSVRGNDLIGQFISMLGMSEANKRQKIVDEFLLTKYEQEDGVKLDKAYLVFIAELPIILRRDLQSPFLTRTGLRLKGIEPIARYAVRRENKEVRLVRGIFNLYNKY